MDVFGGGIRRNDQFAAGDRERADGCVGGAAAVDVNGRGAVVAGAVHDRRAAPDFSVALDREAAQVVRAPLAGIENDEAALPDRP